MGAQRGYSFIKNQQGKKIQQKDFNILDIRLFWPDYKITIFTMIKKIKQTVANVIRELYTLKCGIAEVKRSQIVVVHLKTVNKKFNGQIYLFIYFWVLDTLLVKVSIFMSPPCSFYKVSNCWNAGRRGKKWKIGRRRGILINWISWLMQSDEYVLSNCWAQHHIKYGREKIGTRWGYLCPQQVYLAYASLFSSSNLSLSNLFKIF